MYMFIYAGVSERLVLVCLCNTGVQLPCHAIYLLMQFREASNRCTTEEFGQAVLSTLKPEVL
jgi:hypothetical protein